MREGGASSAAAAASVLAWVAVHTFQTAVIYLYIVYNIVCVGSMVR